PLAAAAAVNLFPIMGLELHGSGTAGAGSVVRIMTFNADGFVGGTDKLMKFLSEAEPDVVAIQEAAQRHSARMQGLTWPPHWHVKHVNEYLLASRWPILDGE